MKGDHQMAMLDQYAGHGNLLKNTRNAYQIWRQADNHLKRLKENSAANLAQKQLLEYQIKELNELSLDEGEYEQLEQEHKRLSNSGELATICQQAIELIYEGEEVNALGILQSANHSLVQLAELDNALTQLPDMLSEAIIQIEEANRELRSYMDNIDVDPARMNYVEERFSKVMSMARKHHVLPSELYQHHQDLLNQIADLDCSDEKLDELHQDVEEAYQGFVKSAEKLSKSRCRYAKELNKLITTSMHELSMEKAQFCIKLINKIHIPRHLASILYVSWYQPTPVNPLSRLLKSHQAENYHAYHLPYRSLPRKKSILQA